jgi:2,4-dienoyl-CoA reductase-like NADH-dependent reductase (Old Yellow Enzyme family)/thioredoxin reductase
VKSRLWEPFRIRQMELKNRIVMPPMGTKHASKEGYTTDHIKDYFEARARGGAGLIIVEATLVHSSGRAYQNLLEITDDKFIPGLSELVRAIHNHGAKVAIQLQHCGRLAKSKFTGMQPVAPSSIPSKGGEVPKELSIREIAQIVKYFADGAVRAKRAGFDGIEIHGAHGYLIDQFLSRSSNKRQDIYGGQVKNRARLLIEVIGTIKEAVGEDFPVWCRINGKEYGVELGTTLDEAKEIARLAQEAGADAIHISAYGPKAPQHLTAPRPVSGVLAELAEGIKETVTVPLIIVGRMTLEAAERMLEEGKADLFAFGKSLLADPELPNKMASGKTEDIRPCILCMACRDDLFFDKGVSVGCQVNPALGREAEFNIIKADTTKKVLIVGGGPAGMEAARVARLRGHEVTLWEKNPRLGGQLNYATIPQHKNGIAPLIKYFQTQLQKLDIKIELGKEATANMVKDFQPEVVVLAIGAVPIIPQMVGGKRDNIVTALEVLNGYKNVRERIAIVGGGLIGCETAEFLAEQGYRDIIILEMLEDIGSDIGRTVKPHILERLKAAGVRMEAGINIVEVSEKGVKGLRKGGSEFFDAQTIVIAVGMKSENNLAKSLADMKCEIYSIGDCVKPRRIREAITEGYKVGL